MIREINDITRKQAILIILLFPSFSISVIKKHMHPLLRIRYNDISINDISWMIRWFKLRKKYLDDLIEDKGSKDLKKANQLIFYRELTQFYVARFYRCPALNNRLGTTRTIFRVILFVHVRNVVCFLDDNSERARKRVNKTAYQVNNLDIFREYTNTTMNNSVVVIDGDLFRTNLT